jgi:phosphoglycolate phosphatase-like HAD superfamily hydrolase
LIGDALSDLFAGQAAGVQKTGLVRTGRGIDQAELASAAQIGPYTVYDTLAQALEELI